MNILLIGSGGRENALSRLLSKSESCNKLYCIPGNPGISRDAEIADMSSSDFASMAEFCKKNDISLVVVGPEQPLADGIADYLTSEGISVFGPSKEPAKLEASKGYAKKFMEKCNIPTAMYSTFSAENKDDAHKYIDSHPLPIVLKADGLAAGKGVIIAVSREEAHQTIDSMFTGMFGGAGDNVVIEEFMEGEEASILAVADGKDYITLASSQDHKRIGEGDTGKNTGEDNVLEKVKNEIIEPAIKGMKDAGTPFIGCLYAGLMINEGQPRVVEFNVRFGDPETQAVLSVFEGDFAGLLKSAADGNLDKSKAVNIQNGAACCVVLAADGYPGSYDKWKEITGIEDAEAEGAIVYHAETATDGEKIVASGGRVLGVTGLGNDLKEAIDNSYKACDKIHFENKYNRTDIGQKGLKRVKDE